MSAQKISPRIRPRQFYQRLLKLLGVRGEAKAVFCHVLPAVRNFKGEIKAELVQPVALSLIKRFDLKLSLQNLIKKLGNEGLIEPGDYNNAFADLCASLIRTKEAQLKLQGEIQIIRRFREIETSIRDNLSQANTLREIMLASRGVIEKLGIGGVAVYRYNIESANLWNVEREELRGVTRYEYPKPMLAGEKRHFIRTAGERGYSRESYATDILQIDRLADLEKMDPDDRVQIEEDLEFDLVRYFGENYAEEFESRTELLKEALRYNFYVRFPGFGPYDMIIMANNHSKNAERVKRSEKPLPLFDSPEQRHMIYETLRNLQKPITDELHKAEASRLKEIQIARKDATQELQAALAKTEDVRELFEMVLDNLPDQYVRDRESYVKNSSIMLLHEEEGVLKIEASRGLSEEIVRNSVAKPGQGIAGTVFVSCKSLLVSDAETDEILSKMPEKKIVSRGSLMSVPIHFLDRKYGVLNVRSAHPKAFKEEGLRHLELIANMLASKIRINNLINLDGLTRLYQRRFGVQKINSMIKRAEEEKKPLFFMILDLDHFKRINDTYGHGAGDAVLKGTAGVIFAWRRKHKKEFEDHIEVRWGGEELAIALLGPNREDALELAEDLRKRIETKEYVFFGEKVFVTVSTGIEILTRAGTLEELYSNADRALYYSKRNGRNQITIFDPSLPFIPSLENSVEP